MQCGQYGACRPHHTLAAPMPHIVWMVWDMQTPPPPGYPTQVPSCHAWCGLSGHAHTLSKRLRPQCLGSGGFFFLSFWLPPRPSDAVTAQCGTGGGQHVPSICRPSAYHFSPSAAFELLSVLHKIRTGFPWALPPPALQDSRAEPSPVPGHLLSCLLLPSRPPLITVLSQIDDQEQAVGLGLFHLT